jgi:ubiquinone/menaquinone biosynthesis C-methylase UbiE
MSVYDDISTVYDQGMLPLEWLILRRLRQRLFPRLQGDVLELGTGTGVNLPLYGPQARVVACDASRQVLDWAARRRTRARVMLVQADAQRLPFASGSFPTTAASLLFCSVAEPARALVEVRRVLRHDGRLALLEHTRGIGLGGWLTRLLDPLWRAWSRECHLDRETTRSVAEAGFVLRRVEQYWLGIVRVIEATV